MSTFRKTFSIYSLLPLRNHCTIRNSLCHTNLSGSDARETSDVFSIASGVRQGCVLAPTLFGIFFSVLLFYTFISTSEGIYLHENQSQESSHQRDSLAAHMQEGLQHPMDRFFKVCPEYGLTISTKKIMVMGRDTLHSMSINSSMLMVVNKVTYLGSIITANLSLDAQINACKVKAASVMGKLSKRNTKTGPSQQTLSSSSTRHACSAWSFRTVRTYSWKEMELNPFHLQCPWCILKIFLTGSCPNYWGTHEGKVNHHTVYPQQAMSRIAQSHLKDVEWTHPKRHPLRTAGIWFPPYRLSPSLLQGRLQKRDFGAAVNEVDKLPRIATAGALAGSQSRGAVHVHHHWQKRTEKNKTAANLAEPPSHLLMYSLQQRLALQDWAV